MWCYTMVNHKLSITLSIPALLSIMLIISDKFESPLGYLLYLITFACAVGIIYDFTHGGMDD